MYFADMILPSQGRFKGQDYAVACPKKEDVPARYELSYASADEAHLIGLKKELELLALGHKFANDFHELVEEVCLDGTDTNNVRGALLIY